MRILVFSFQIWSNSNFVFFLIILISLWVIFLSECFSNNSLNNPGIIPQTRSFLQSSTQTQTPTCLGLVSSSCGYTLKPSFFLRESLVLNKVPVSFTQRPLITSCDHRCWQHQGHGAVLLATRQTSFKFHPFFPAGLSFFLSVCLSSSFPASFPAFPPSLLPFT